MKYAIAVSLVLALFGAAFNAQAAPGMLLVAHGSPSKEWNASIQALSAKVEAALQPEGKFKAVRTAFLESAKPDVPSVLSELEAAGCDRVIAVPLFVAPSGHSHFDVPAVLGIYASSATRAALRAEGASLAIPKIPVTLTQTLSEGDLLERYALEQVKKASTGAPDEAIVLLAHGDADHEGLNERLLRRIAAYCCGRSGIDYADWAYVEMGQGYNARAIPAFERAQKEKKRVIVVGLYVATTAKALHERATKQAPGHGVSSNEAANLVFSDESLVDNPELVRWVVETASSSLSL